MNIVLRNSTESVEVSDAVFGCEFNEPLVHQVLNSTIAKGHTGTRAQKNRSAVRGGGRKPWRQKRMDRARAGTRRSPMWRGGGVIFPASPIKRNIKINRKMFRQAMRCILSELLREERLVVISDLGLESPKTKELKQKLQDLETQQVLLVDNEPSNNLQLAAKNLPHVAISLPHQLRPTNLLSQEQVLISLGALKQIEASLA
ncbi:MAG: 50S ribosomal protein L4 [Gammaproteobacteria bacterium]|nr:50S ribosomal protein L4 [Gammaproteobacteria bacterium]